MKQILFVALICSALAFRGRHEKPVEDSQVPEGSMAPPEFPHDDHNHGPHFPHPPHVPCEDGSESCDSTIPPPFPPKDGSDVPLGSEVPHFPPHHPHDDNSTAPFEGSMDSRVPPPFPFGPKHPDHNNHIQKDPRNERKRVVKQAGKF
ncbi:hypothetical protein EIN_248950 [Entamoeba invadens IP1]|uniref:Uncharacterized protein n=1 Tax=Entamoeba invadens IP1 TaxID=370355 RepID=A0A0A1UE38_ENTIV|nr:hypothetical protein EIN_248950 [Entamoeba invadens IP1]ELP94871.1 hypothetical protein EIN_248950 [Entamoeba invadens IP1]|eukprot:XP_004261642.1 hypothetical protein EIN_248950 [Entamoeba invadens IP1]